MHEEKYCTYLTTCYRSAARRAATYSRLFLTVPRPHSLANFFENIEHSSSKGDFKVGLEARYDQDKVSVTFNLLAKALGNN